MRKIAITISIVFLLFSISLAAEVNLENFKKTNKIVFEEDLDGDEVPDLIPISLDLNTPPIVYLNKNGRLDKLTADKAVSKEILLFNGFPRIYILKNKGEKVIFYIKSFSSPLQGSTYASGNIIAAYKVKNNGYVQIKRMFSEYKLKEGALKYDTVSEENIPLGRQPFTNVVVNGEKDNLLLQSADKLFILNSSAELKQLESTYFENLIAERFKVGVDNIVILFKKMISNEYAVWNSKNKKITGFIDIGPGGLIDSALEDGSENMFSITIRNAEGVFKMKYEINSNNEIKEINRVEIK